MISTSDRALIGNQLRYFDCNERETAIFLDLLLNGPSTIQELARRLRQHRVTAHSAVEQLLRKGLLYETRQRKKRFVAAEEPEALFRLLQQRENEIAAARANLSYLTEILRHLPTRDRSIPTVKFYEGVEGFRRMLEETLHARSEVLVFTYVDLFAELIGEDYLFDYYRRRAERGISTRLIFPRGAFAKKAARLARQNRMTIRVLPRLRWNAGIFSWNDCLALKSFTEGKITCSIIENRDISHFYRNVIFELAWAQAEPVVTKMK